MLNRIRLIGSLLHSHTLMITKRNNQDFCSALWVPTCYSIVPKWSILFYTLDSMPRVGVYCISRIRMGHTQALKHFIPNINRYQVKLLFAVVFLLFLYNSTPPTCQSLRILLFWTRLKTTSIQVNVNWLRKLLC